MSSHHSTAIVTGASSALGGELCRQLASRCNTIVAISRHKERLHELAASLTGQVDVQIIEADLAAEEGLTRVVEALRQRGPVDYLVNAARIRSETPFDGSAPASHHTIIRVQIDATITLCRAAIGFMRERGHGTIINVATTDNTALDTPLLSACDAFIRQFSHALRQDVSHTDIRIQSLDPQRPVDLNTACLTP